jgi:hypothetical protein
MEDLRRGSDLLVFGEMCGKGVKNKQARIFFGRIALGLERVTVYQRYAALSIDFQNLLTGYSTEKGVHDFGVTARKLFLRCSKTANLARV